MKLVFAIVNNEDGNLVLRELTKAGFSVTKMASTGGFLRSGNTTLLVGTEAENV
ncbi:MAG: cyclic-di-AMP receptor, partial [Clostridia bacterium]|nr:cyclic-di-AMP receptor [Clostridia bacterium]